MSGGTDRGDSPDSDSADGPATREVEAKQHPMSDGPYDQSGADPPAEAASSGEATGSAVGENEAGVIVEALGNIGVYLAVVSLVLAIVGLVLGTFRIHPIASISLFFSLILATVSMILGAVFQAFGTDRPLLP